MASLDRQTYKSSWNPNVAEMVLKFDDDSGAGAAGTYASDVTVPAGAYIIDVQVHCVAVWNAGTSAALDVGDADDADLYYDNVNCKATNLTAGEVLSFGHDGGLAGVGNTDDDGLIGGYQAAKRQVKASIVCAGTAATTGETRIIVIWAKPTDSVSSSFTAA
jgi:hypothetical protein